MVGWGMWNNIGGMLAMLLPIHFYFAATIKKYGILFEMYRMWKEKWNNNAQKRENNIYKFYSLMLRGDN